MCIDCFEAPGDANELESCERLETTTAGRATARLTFSPPGSTHHLMFEKL